MQNKIALNFEKNNDVNECLTFSEKEILELADDEIDINSHNYRNFVDSRDKFREKIKEVCYLISQNEEKISKVKKVIQEL